MDKDTLKNIVYAQMEEQEKLQLAQQIIRTKLALITHYTALPQAIVICGMRRSGKSTLMQQIQTKYYPTGGYYLTFEDERLLDFSVQDFTLLHEVLIELQGEKQVFFFDEIQNINKWELFIRRMIQQGYKFYLTGSNAAMLSQELGTRLTGRNIVVELLPYSFKEYLDFNEVPIKKNALLSVHKKARIKKWFHTFLIEGGMPEYLQYKNAEILAHTYDDIIYRDIISRYKIKDIAAFRRLALYLFNHFASRVTYNSLKPLVGIAHTTTISNYVFYLENSYLIFTVNQFSYSLKQQNLLPKKIYVIDNGIAHSIALQFSDNKGCYLENCVYLELRRRFQEIYYYQTMEQFEVDFIIFEKGKPKLLIQVCYKLTDTATQEREIRALISAMDEMKLTEALILTDDQQDVLTMDHKKIIIKPVYQWLLEPI